MHFKYIFIFFFLSSISYSQYESGLKKTIKNLLKQEKIVGAVWCIISQNGNSTIDSYGYKNNQTREIISSNAKMNVGSVSKTVLAAGVLRMVTLGLLKLDDPVKKYLPSLPIENQWDKTSKVTIRHLLDNTSGLTDAKLWHIFSTTAKADTPLNKVYQDDVSVLKVQYKPGSIDSYSNLGYSILGMVIEKITKQPYESYLDNTILKPLGMTESTFHFISQSGKFADEKLAFGHFDNGNPVASIPMYLRAAGQFTTTANDMAKFMWFMMSDGLVNGKTFIDKNLLSKVGIQKSTDAYKKGVPYGYALGAYQRDRYGAVGVAKNGNTLGFSAMLYMFPESKKAFFIAYNMDSETADYDLFNNEFTNYLGVNKINKNLKKQKIENSLTEWNGYYIPIITVVKPFKLIDWVFSNTKVTFLGNDLVIKPFQGKNKTLFYLGNNTFSMKGRTNVTHTLYKDQNGDLLISDGIRTIKKVSGIKILSIAFSFLIGILSIFYFFVYGLIRFFKIKVSYFKGTYSLMFAASLFLLVSIFLFSFQPFMEMGNLTFINILLFASSILLSIASIYVLIHKLIGKENFMSFDFLATFSIAQFSILLIINGVFPVIMWR